MNLAEKLRKIIQDSGLSLPEFAQRVGKSKNTIINYRDGRSTPSMDFIEKVCKEFSVNPISLILDKGDLYLLKIDKNILIGKLFYIDDKDAATLLVLKAMIKTDIRLTPQGIDKFVKIVYDDIWDGMIECAADALKALVKAIPRWKLKDENLEDLNAKQPKKEN